MKNWFFIAGNFRSGTTLMRLCLDSHPDIQCFDELSSYDMLGGEYKAIRYNEVMANKSPLIGFKVPIRTMVLPLAWPVWNERYGPGKCIFMLRDPGAVVSSMRRLNGGKYWNSQNQERALKSLGRPQFRGNYVNDIEELASVADYGVGVAALHWKASTDTYYRLKKEGRDIMGVRYEDLVSHPGEVLQGVCKFLGVPFDESVLAPEKASHMEVRGRIAIGGSELRSIDADSVDRWRQDLSVERQAVVAHFTDALKLRLQTENDSTPLIGGKR